DIRDYSNQLGQQLQTKSQDFQRQVQSYQQAAETMTEDARVQKEKELTALQQEIQKFEGDAQTSYQRKLQELLEPVQTKVENTITGVAAENNDTAIDGATGGAVHVRVYTRDDDISDEIESRRLRLSPPAKPAR